MAVVVFGPSLKEGKEGQGLDFSEGPWLGVETCGWGENGGGKLLIKNSLLESHI